MLELMIDEKTTNSPITDIAIKTGSRLLRYALPLSAGLMVGSGGYNPKNNALILSAGVAAAFGEGVQHKYFQFVRTFGHPSDHSELVSKEARSNEYQELPIDLRGGGINGGITGMALFSVGYGIGKLLE